MHPPKPCKCRERENGTAQTSLLDKEYFSTALSFTLNNVHFPRGETESGVTRKGLQKFREVPYKAADNYIRGDKSREEEGFKTLRSNQTLTWLNYCNYHSEGTQHCLY